MVIRYLTIADFEIVIDEYKHHFANFQDPLPDLQSCDKNKIDSIIAIPQKTFSGKDLYPNVFHKAACYLYFINKMHPFYNGNKRMSVFVTNIFLMMNNYELTFSDDQMYELAKMVTLSSHDQTKQLHEVGLALKNHAKSIQDNWAPFRNSWFFVINFFKRIGKSQDNLHEQEREKHNHNGHTKKDIH